MDIDKILSNVKDYHLPIFIAMFSIGGFLQWFHRLDGTFVAFTTAIVGGLTTHAVFSPTQKDEDKG